jgi:hypothetical protein
MEHKGQNAHRWTNQAIRANATAEKLGRLGDWLALMLLVLVGWLGSAIGED